MAIYQIDPNIRTVIQFTQIPYRKKKLFLLSTFLDE